LALIIIPFSKKTKKAAGIGALTGYFWLTKSGKVNISFF